MTFHAIPTPPHLGGTGLALRTRVALASDRAFVERLHEDAYHDVVVRQFGAWDEARQQRHFAEKWRDWPFQLILDDNEPVGVLVVVIETNQVHLHQLLVAPHRQRQGIGSAALRHVQDQARVIGGPVRLGVLFRNRARRLYERHGFEVYACSRTHYLMHWPAATQGGRYCI